MKEKYELLQWYPSLNKRWKTTHTYEYQRSTGYMCNKSIQHCVVLYKEELHPDFWQLIEEKKPNPLFVTDDGVEMFEVSTQKMFVVRLSDCEKFIFDTSVWSNISNESKVYYHESNADEYIWKNKPLFNYNELVNSGLIEEYGEPFVYYSYQKRALEKLAKERIEK